MNPETTRRFKVGDWAVRMSEHPHLSFPDGAHQVKSLDEDGDPEFEVPMNSGWFGWRFHPATQAEIEAAQPKPKRCPCLEIVGHRNFGETVDGPACTGSAHNGTPGVSVYSTECDCTSCIFLRAQAAPPKPGTVPLKPDDPSLEDSREDWSPDLQAEMVALAMQRNRFATEAESLIVERDLLANQVEDLSGDLKESLSECVVLKVDLAEALKEPDLPPIWFDRITGKLIGIDITAPGDEKRLAPGERFYYFGVDGLQVGKFLSQGARKAYPVTLTVKKPERGTALHATLKDTERRLAARGRWRGVAVLFFVLAAACSGAMGLQAAQLDRLRGELHRTQTILELGK